MPLTPLTPDNGIRFLNNGLNIVNPNLCKTPPPPMWGDILEEENYDKTQPFYIHKPDPQMEEMQRRIQERVQSGEVSEEDSKRYVLKKKVVYAYELDHDRRNSP